MFSERKKSSVQLFEASKPLIEHKPEHKKQEEPLLHYVAIPIDDTAEDREQEISTNQSKTDIRQPLIDRKMVDEQKAAVVNIENKEDSLPKLKEKAKKLMLCIAILKSQIIKEQVKKRAPTIVPRVVLLGAIITAVSHLVTSINKFYKAVAQFNSTIQPSIFGAAPEFCNRIFMFDISLFAGNGCVDSLSKHIQGAIRNRELLCASAMQNICDNPAMNNWYFPVIINVGMTIPVAIFGVHFWLCRKQAEQETFLKLPTGKANTILRYATEYQINFSANASLQEIKALFEKRLKTVNLYLVRHAFLMGSRSSATINELFKLRGGAAIKIVRKIFEYAGCPAKLEENSARLKAFMDGSHIKNSPYNNFQLMKAKPADQEIKPHNFYIYQTNGSPECAVKSHKGMIERISLKDNLNDNIYLSINESLNKRWDYEVTLNSYQSKAIRDFLSTLDVKIYSQYRKLYDLKLVKDQPADQKIQPRSLYIYWKKRNFYFYQTKGSLECAIKRMDGKIERISLEGKIKDNIYCSIQETLNSQQHWGRQLDDIQKAELHKLALKRGYSDGKLYSFFEELDKKKENGDYVYDRTKIIKNIFRYSL